MVRVNIQARLPLIKFLRARHADLARKLDANVCVTNFRVFFAAYRARVQGPLPNALYGYNESLSIYSERH